VTTPGADRGPAARRAPPGPRRGAAAVRFAIRQCRLGLLALPVAALPVNALAHQAGLSYGRVEAEAGGGVRLELRLPAAETEAAWPTAAARDRGGAPAALGGEVLGAISATRAGAACSLRPGEARREPPDGLQIGARLRCPPGSGPVELRLDFLTRMAPGHVHLASVARGGRAEERVLDARHVALTVEPAARWWSEPARFLALGVEHIFTGLDHVAFVLGLLLAGGVLGAVVRLVTCFTAAHALTLALAALGVLRPPAALVEPLIAASVLCVGLENLRQFRRTGRPEPGAPAGSPAASRGPAPGHALRTSSGPGEAEQVRRPERPSRTAAGGRWRNALAFGFGLVHGFGFAGALEGLAPTTSGLLTALASFNVGVELGQAAIVAAAFPLLAALRRRPRLFPPVARLCSAAVGAAGLFWLVERLGAG